MKTIHQQYEDVLKGHGPMTSNEWSVKIAEVYPALLSKKDLQGSQHNPPVTGHSAIQAEVGRYFCLNNYSSAVSRSKNVNNHWVYYYNFSLTDAIDNALRRIKEPSTAMEVFHSVESYGDLALTKSKGKTPDRTIDRYLQEGVMSGKYTRYRKDDKTTYRYGLPEWLDSSVISIGEEHKLDRPDGEQNPVKSMDSKPREVFKRDPVVKKWVLQEANGVCECCGKPAPFIKKDGTPFLEHHHVKQLADGGSDTPENSVALCPDCHRAFHYSQDKDLLVDKIYDTVLRLKREDM